MYMNKRAIITILSILLLHNVYAEESNISLLPLDSASRSKVKSYLPKVIGFLDARYIYDESNDPDNEFVISRARIGVQGSVTPKISYRIMGEFASNAELLDGYVKYSHNKHFNITFGQFKLPVTMDNTRSSFVYSTIETTVSTRHLIGNSDSLRHSSYDYDMGAFVSGSFIDKGKYSLISYKAGVVNGQGMNQSDKNRGKEGFVTIEINPIEEVTIAGSFIGGRTGESGVNEYISNRWSLGVMYERDGLMARSEYINALTAEERSDAFYAVAEVGFVKNFTAVGKYNIFRRNLCNHQLNENYYTAGINYILGSHFRVQLNYTYLQMYKAGYNIAGLQLKVRF